MSQGKDAMRDAALLPRGDHLHWGRQMAAAAASVAAGGANRQAASDNGQQAEPQDSRSLPAGDTCASTAPFNSEGVSNGSGAADAPAASATGGDPFAFNMGAFGGGDSLGISGAEQHSDSAGASAGDRDTGQQDIAQREQARSAAVSDLFAFDMGAFGGGFGSVQAEVPPADADGNDPYAADRHEAEEDAQLEAARPPSASTAHADPFAFDMGAFGGSSLGGAEEPQAAAPLGKGCRRRQRIQQQPDAPQQRVCLARQHGGC